MDAALVIWTAAWLVAGVYVYTSVRRLEDYGETTVTASIGLDQASRGLVRAAGGLRDTGSALARIPFVGEQIGSNIRVTAADVDRIALTVRKTARQARASGVETRSTANGIALVLGAAVAVVPTLPIIALYLLLRPVIGQQLGRP